MTPKHSLFSSLGRRLGGLFKKETTPEAGPRALSDRGLLAFSHTGDVIRAERLLRQQGFDVEVKGPPRRCAPAVTWWWSFRSSGRPQCWPG